jgi:hypothetical protein
MCSVEKTETGGNAGATRLAILNRHNRRISQPETYSTHGSKLSVNDPEKAILICSIAVTIF